MLSPPMGALVSSEAENAEPSSGPSRVAAGTWASSPPSSTRLTPSRPSAFSSPTRSSGRRHPQGRRVHEQPRDNWPVAQSSEPSPADEASRRSGKAVVAIAFAVPGGRSAHGRAAAQPRHCAPRPQRTDLLLRRGISSTTSTPRAALLLEVDYLPGLGDGAIDDGRVREDPPVTALEHRYPGRSAARSCV